MASPIKTSATVTAVDSFGEGVYRVEMEPHKRIPRFRPGQFLHLTMDDYDPQGGFWPESRVFSIASSPDDSHITIVYSVKGKYTTRMRDELRPQRQVWLKLPYGDFCIDTRAQAGNDVVLLAGGTGLSPFIPFLRTQRQAPADRRIVLVYGIRKQEHLLFHEILEACVREAAGFSLQLHVEEKPSRTLIAGIDPIVGRIRVDRVLDTVGGMRSPNFFISGPPQMIRDGKALLASRGIGESNIHVDSWE